MGDFDSTSRMGSAVLGGEYQKQANSLGFSSARSSAAAIDMDANISGGGGGEARRKPIDSVWKLVALGFFWVFSGFYGNEPLASSAPTVRPRPLLC